MGMFIFCPTCRNQAWETELFSDEYDCPECGVK